MAYSSITKPSDYFNTKLYTGNDGTNAITGVGFQPDFNWIKDRTSTGEHLLVDAVRGMYNIRSNSTAAESANGSIHQQSLDSDGFTVAGSAGNSNASGRNYASWNWKANGTGSANTDGTINSTVSANTTSGFSIVSYTGNGTNPSTVGHGLGFVPKMIITKPRSSTGAWHSYHVAIGNGAEIYLDKTNAQSNNTTWNSTTPTSSVFTIGNGDVNTNGTTYIAYCFAEKKGYSKFGSYTGNGSTDGTFVYTGFKPAFILRKRTDSTSSWLMQDNRRPGSNRPVTDSLPTDNNVLYPNTNDTELFNNELDILSNGFKIRAIDTFGNASGGNYIFMAFAEEPLVANVGAGVPATAR